MKISAIFFDLGNVLVRFYRDQVIEQLVPRSTLTREEIDHLLISDPSFLDYEMGKITTAQALAHWKECLNFSGSVDELETIYCNAFEPIERHIEYASLLSRHYPVAVLSNTSEAHIRTVEKQYGFFDIFRDKIYSYEVGLRKPDPAIYQLALERMKADRFETLFIDDLEENILTPAKMGWQTIHLRPDVNLLYALQSYDLEGVRALDI